MKNTGLAALLALTSLVQAQQESGHLIDSSYASEPAKPTNPSQYVGGCPAPKVVDSGFDVTYRLCEDALPFRPRWWFPPYNEQGGSGNGANPGPAPQGYPTTGGCYNGYLKNSRGQLTGQMNPDFVTDYVYKGDHEYHYPNGITEPNFWRETWWPTTGNIYGKSDLQTTGFSLDLTGYYLAPQTGQYTFELNADDEASLQLGRGKTCCGDFHYGGLITSQIVSTTNGIGPKQATSEVSLRGNTYTVHLTEGVYYPMRVVYFNNVGSFVLQLDVILPDGRKSSDWSDVKQIDTSAYCPKITTVPWTGSFVTDTTHTYTSDTSTVTEIIVQTQAPTTTTTVETPWTGFFTSTYSTASGLVSYQGGSQEVVTDYVETPYSERYLTTVTTNYTGSTPTTTTEYGFITSLNLPIHHCNS